MKNDSLFISNIHEQFIKAKADTSAEAEIFIINFASPPSRPSRVEINDEARNWESKQKLLMLDFLLNSFVV